MELLDLVFLNLFIVDTPLNRAVLGLDVELAQAEFEGGGHLTFYCQSFWLGWTATTLLTLSALSRPELAVEDTCCVLFKDVVAVEAVFERPDQLEAVKLLLWLLTP